MIDRVMGLERALAREQQECEARGKEIDELKAKNRELQESYQRHDQLLAESIENHKRCEAELAKLRGCEEYAKMYFRDFERLTPQQRAEGWLSMAAFDPNEPIDIHKRELRACARDLADQANQLDRAEDQMLELMLVIDALQNELDVYRREVGHQATQLTWYRKLAKSVGKRYPWATGPLSR